MMSQMLQLIEESCNINFVSDQTFTGWAIKWAKKKKLALEEGHESYLESRKCNLYYHYSVCHRRLINTLFRLWSQQGHERAKIQKSREKREKVAVIHETPLASSKFE